MSQTYLTNFYSNRSNGEDDETENLFEGDFYNKSTNQMLIMSQKRMKVEKSKYNSRVTIKNRV